MAMVAKVTPHHGHLHIANADQGLLELIIELRMEIRFGSGKQQNPRHHDIRKVKSYFLTLRLL
jgi:hypothetical protein